MELNKKVIDNIEHSCEFVNDLDSYVEALMHSVSLLDVPSELAASFQQKCDLINSNASKIRYINIQLRKENKELKQREIDNEKTLKEAKRIIDNHNLIAYLA
jgi:predicted translin family RNA/ssDNA-binding protein